MRSSILAILICLPIAGQMIPLVGKLFWVVYPVCIVCLFFSSKEKQTIQKSFPDAFTASMILSLIIFSWALYQTSGHQIGFIYREGLRGLIFALIFYFLDIIKLGDEEAKEITTTVFKVVLLLTITVSFAGVVKFLYVTSTEHHNIYLGVCKIGCSPPGTSLMYDYNFFALSCLYGIATCLYFVKKEQNGSFQFLILISMGLILSTGYLTGSRRFLIIALAFSLPIFLLVFQIPQKQRLTSAMLKSAQKYYGLNLNGAYAILLILLVPTLLFAHFFTSDTATQSLAFQPLDRIQASLSGNTASRLDRWLYALTEFYKNPTIFGSGFSYRQDFACEFSNCEGNDYPHNPILSALLYGGVFGAMLTTLIFLHALYLSYKCFLEGFRKQVVAFFMLITVLYCLISGDTIFSTTILFSTLLLVKINSKSRI